MRLAVGTKQVRAALALLLAGSAAAYGVALAGPPAVAATVTPQGGCWAYVASGPALDAPPASHLSTSLEDWTTDPAGGLTLETGGATATGGSRTVTTTVVSGPVIGPLDATGTASFLFSVDGTPLAAPVEVGFDVDGGQPVENLAASVTIPAGTAGAHQVRLDGIYFDAPGRRLACNGQETGDPAGVNPATAPQPTDVVASWTTVAGASLAITGIAEQAVLTSGRAGDAVSVRVAGLASSTTAVISVCGTGGSCATAAGIVTAPDGSATTTFVVPGDAPVGAGAVRVDDGTTRASVPFGVLGVQTLAASERLGADSTTVTLTGSGWDPARPVTIRGYAGKDSSSAVTKDPQVSATTDAAGTFTATYEVADDATVSVIADQVRTTVHIGSVYLISGVIGGAAVPGGEEPPTDGGEETPTDDDEESPSDGGTGTDGGSDSGSGSGSGSETPGVVTPVAPPQDIPLPPDLPVTEPEAPAPSDEVVEDLAVSEVRLDGQATLSELFGGSPERDLVFIVSNLGDETVADPIVRVSVGRSEDVEPEVVDAEVGVLDPGEQAVVTVPLALPMAAFGTYQVVGQVGDTENGSFATEWTTYPWGLFALNAVALALLALGVRHRLGLRRTSRAAALDLPGGESVVDLAAADAWWGYRAGGPKPVVRPPLPPLPAGSPAAGPAPDEPVPGEAVVDLAAAEKWWSSRARDRASKAS